MKKKTKLTKIGHFLEESCESCFLLSPSPFKDKFPKLQMLQFKWQTQWIPSPNNIP